MVYTDWLFDSSLMKSLNAIKERIELNKAAMIVIDGGVGEGKTTLATEIAQWFQPGWFDHVSELLAMGGNDFTKKLEKAFQGGHKVVVYDEGGDFASRGALTQFNKNLNRVFETYRSTQILVILCLPDFSDLDKSLMKKRITRLLIHTHGRKKTYGRFKFFSLWRMWYIKEKMKEVTVPTQAYSIVTPNGRGLFKDLEQDKRDELAKLSNKGKSHIRKDTYIKSKGLLSTDEAAKKMGISTQRFSQVKRMNKLKHDETLGRTQFYKTETIDRLIQQRTQ